MAPILASDGLAPDVLTPGLDRDLAGLRAKYRAERDKRLRADGNAQYVQPSGDQAHYLGDPYATRAPDRATLHDEVDVVIVGGGFGGLIAGARLREAGVQNLRIIEQGADFGGTWYWNRYPGAACDIESYIYLPLLEETGTIPTEKYIGAPEIFAHSRRIAKHYSLYQNACLQTTVTETRWDDSRKRWRVATDRGDAMHARFLVMSNGPLNRPKLPGIAGISDFQGHSFHTSRWDYAYTGGDVAGNLHKLTDKRVAIIGTGATAVQCVPHLAAHAKHLYVCQRTPSSVDRRDNRPTDMDWAASLTPGWQKQRMDNFNILVSGGYQAEDLVSDGWTDIIRNLIFIAQKPENAGLPREKLMELAETADDQKMDEIRRRVQEQVADPAVAELLKPWYRQFCKRPCFHDSYLQAFNQPNVTLVDTNGRGVESISQNAIIANGQSIEIDCLIYATGFEVGTGVRRRTGHPIIGRDDVLLDEAWRDGARSLHGILVHGFANMFLLGGPQGGWTANYPHNLNEQAKHVAHIVQHAQTVAATTIEATPDAEQDWVSTIVQNAMIAETFQKECTPGYYNNEGQSEKINRQNATYGGGSMAYFQILQAWRDDGKLAGLRIT